MIAGFSLRHAVPRRLAATLIALAALAAQPVMSQAVMAQTAAPKPSPTAILVAKQIVELKGARNLYVPLIRGVVEKTKNMFMQTNFMWSKDLNEVAAIEIKKYEPRVDELMDNSARIYASHFTEQELKDLLAFYKSPLGQKALIEEPKALDQSMADAGTWGDNLSQEVIADMRDQMKKRGHDM